MDNSKLFSDVNESVHDDAFKRLQALRAEHPEYRDDQLLMYLVCQGYSDWHIPTNQKIKAPAKRIRKDIKVHWKNADNTGALCATKSQSLTSEGLRVTCKRCLHLMANKTLHPKTMHSVQLVSNGPNRIAVIKAIREHAAIGLKEAKELSDIPYYDGGSVKIGTFEFEQASRLIAAIEAAGGKAEMV